MPRWKRGRTRDVPAMVAEVVRQGNCTGCGLCASLDERLRMELDDAGHLRPRTISSTPDHGQRVDGAALLRRGCPGLVVDARAVAPRHPQLGPLLGCWSAWAVDEAQRHRGSSGGVITALSGFALSTGRGPAVVAASGSREVPRRTTSVVLSDPRAVLRAAGSRYAPASNAAQLRNAPAGAVFVGKPCEVSAATAVAGAEGLQTGLRISFFCAGTPSQHATDALVSRLGWDEGTPLTSVKYRGGGWPGDFEVSDGQEARSLSYQQSWGEVLGKQLPMRCKICPDGLGWSADVSVGDFWETDQDGYPVFDEGRGVSCVLARTPAGLALVRDALDAGVVGGRPLDPDLVPPVQPLQVERLATLPGRLAGRRLAGRSVPRYRGFGLLGRLLHGPRENLRSARGTLRRSRSSTGS